MTPSEVEKLAREAGFIVTIGDAWAEYRTPTDRACSIELTGFAELIERAAMEKAAKIAEARIMGDNNREDEEARRCAAAIRAAAQKDAT